MQLDSMDIGKHVRRLRKISNKSQEEFAEMIDTTSRTVSNVENGVVIPNIKTLANIAKCCNTSIDEIVGVEKNED